MLLDNSSIGLDISRTYGRGGGEEDNDLLSIEELLSSVGKPQAWRQTGSSNKQVTGGSEGNLEDAVKNDGNIVASSGSSEGVNDSGYISSTRRRRWYWQPAEKSVPIGDDRLKDRNTYTRTNKFIALRKQKPIFKNSFTLEPNDWDNRVNLSRKEPGSLGECLMCLLVRRLNTSLTFSRWPDCGLGLGHW